MYAGQLTVRIRARSTLASENLVTLIFINFEMMPLVPLCYTLWWATDKRCGREQVAGQTIQSWRLRHRCNIITGSTWSTSWGIGDCYLPATGRQIRDSMWRIEDVYAPVMLYLCRHMLLKPEELHWVEIPRNTQWSSVFGWTVELRPLNSP